MLFRGTVGKGKATGLSRCLILQMSAFWGRRGEFEGGEETPFYAQAKRVFPPPLNPNKTRNTQKQKSPSR